MEENKKESEVVFVKSKNLENLETWLVFVHFVFGLFIPYQVYNAIIAIIKCFNASNQIVKTTTFWDSPIFHTIFSSVLSVLVCIVIYISIVKVIKYMIRNNAKK